MKDEETRMQGVLEGFELREFYMLLLVIGYSLVMPNSFCDPISQPN